MPKNIEKRISKETVKNNVLAVQKKLKKLVEEIEELKNSYSGQAGHWSKALNKIIHPQKDEGLQKDLNSAENIVLGLPDINFNNRLQDLAGYLDGEFNLLHSAWQLIIDTTFVLDKDIIDRNLKELQGICDTIKSLILQANSAVSETL